MILKIKLKLILKCYEKNYEIVKKLKKPKNAVLEKKNILKIMLQSKHEIVVFTSLAKKNVL